MLQSAPPSSTEEATVARERRAPVALSVALALVALFLPAWSREQALYAGSFGLALVVLGVYGSVLARRLLGVARPCPWTAVYLGQFALLAVAAMAMPLNGFAARWLGTSLPLTALVLAPAVVLGLVQFRRRPPSAPVFPSAPVQLSSPVFLLGLASLALAVAIYSEHLSALGLDIHEHIAWIRQIVSNGYVPLAEPGTRIVGDYPRTFHVVAALWDAAGLGLPAGPFAKVMPFVQNALPLLSIAEQLVESDAPPGSSSRTRLEVVLGLAFFVYSFLIVPMVYPVPDLLGTPRFSSNGILMLPIVLAVLAHARKAPRASALALTTAPLAAAWALTWNPIVLVLLGVVTVPVLAAFWVTFRPPRPREVPARFHALALLASCALAVLVVAQDPWVVGVAARNIGAVRAVIHRAGLVSFDEAVAQGLATPRDKSVRNLRAAPPCHDARCVAGKAVDAARAALSAPWNSAATALADAARLVRGPSLTNQKDAFKAAFVMQPALIADYAGLPFFVWIAAGVLLAAWRSLRRREVSADAKLLTASLLGLAAAGMALTFAATLAAALNDQRHESFILAGYLGVSRMHVTLGLLWFPFAGATLVLARRFIVRSAGEESGSPSRSRWWVAAMGLAVWLALPLLGRLNLHRPLQHGGFWTRIGLEDLRALRDVEESIPADDGVIVPAEHANIAQWEHWVLPLGETAALLPYGERRYLFNVYLGASYPLSWRDLADRMCSEDPAIRAAFFRATRARWVLIRDRSGADAAAVVNQPWPKMCGVSVAALGAELPPVREERGIFLFRLRAPQIEAQRPPP